MKNYIHISKLYYFTMIEIVIAISILVLGIMSAMELNTIAKKRIDKTYQKWKLDHALSQGTEYYLLTNDTGKIPLDFFPYFDYDISCIRTESDSLPHGINAHYKDWYLGKYEITVLNKKHNNKKTIIIEKILKRK